MKINNSESISDPPRVKTFLRPPTKIRDLLLYYASRYELRNDIFCTRREFGIPPEGGLGMTLLTNVDDVECSCLDKNAPLEDKAWLYKQYGEWHKSHRHQVHNGEFSNSVRRLREKYFPKEDPWYAFTYYLLLFNAVVSIPSPREKLDGKTLINLESRLPDSASHPYDLDIFTKTKIPRIELKIYRNMSHKDWVELMGHLELRAENYLPLDLPKSRVNIALLVKVADYKRQGFSNRDIARMLGDNFAESSISKIAQRSRELGL